MMLVLFNFHAANNSDSFKFTQKTTGKIANASGKKDVETMVPLKYLSKFARTLEMPLINCEINLILTRSQKRVITNDKKATTFPMTDTKLYVPAVTLSTQDNAKLLQQLKPGFQRTINWKKYQSKVSTQTPKAY